VIHVYGALIFTLSGNNPRSFQLPGKIGLDLSIIPFSNDPVVHSPLKRASLIIIKLAYKNRGNMEYLVLHRSPPVKKKQFGDVGGSTSNRADGPVSVAGGACLPALVLQFLGSIRASQSLVVRGPICQPPPRLLSWPVNNNNRVYYRVSLILGIIGSVLSPQRPPCPCTALVAAVCSVGDVANQSSRQLRISILSRTSKCLSIYSSASRHQPPL
jgi:hypothetical protein